jgi:hypothetical protein
VRKAVGVAIHATHLLATTPEVAALQAQP